MSRQSYIFTVQVESEERPEVVRRILNRLINIGLEEAYDVVNENEAKGDNLIEAQAALDADFHSPEDAYTGDTTEELKQVQRGLYNLNELYRSALTDIVFNAKEAPDPTMDNATDCYVVPIDDILKAREALGQ
ncbi:MAG: hypothetical protein ACRDFB_04500 [Rhabdochlamydiaceae bacterium]